MTDITDEDRRALATLDDALGFLMDNEREIVASALSAHRLAAEARGAERERALETEIKRINRIANDRQYFIDALVNMLGPNGLKVWKGWQARQIVRVHYSWGPEAASMTGEERAAAILEWDEAAKSGELIHDVDHLPARHADQGEGL